MRILVLHRPMDCGKSTLALQLDYTHTVGGPRGRLFTSQDRAGEATISSRLGLAKPAIEVGIDFDFWTYVVGQLTGGERVDYLVCDEAQFYSPGRWTSWPGSSMNSRWTCSRSAC